MNTPNLILYSDNSTIEVTWKNDLGIITSCRAYSGGQMDALSTDLGEYYSQYASFIQSAISNYIPPLLPPIEIPYSVTPFQAKAAMYNTMVDGNRLLDLVISLINNPSTSYLTKLAWDSVTEFTRDSPLLNGLATQLGLSSQQVDELFIAASQIEI